MASAIGWKSARKWLELLTTRIFSSSGGTPSERNISRSAICALVETSAIFTSPMRSRAEGPMSIVRPEKYPPRARNRPSVSFSIRNSAS